VSPTGALTLIAGSPFTAGSRGTATRLVYFSQFQATEVPTLDPRGLAALAALLVLAAVRILNRRRAPIQ